MALLADILDDLPPIVVHSPSQQVIDGAHRVMAARSLRRASVAAVLFHGPESDAAALAVQCNVAHGKPLTRTERQAAAAALLAKEPGWSDRRVAAVCGLSSKTIAGIRKRVTAETPQLRDRVGRDGKARPADPVELRHRIADAVQADPTASTRSIAARVGASQGTVRDVRERLRTGQQILPDRLTAAAGPVEQGDDSEGSERPKLKLSGNAYEARPQGREFMEWFDSLLLTDDNDWTPYVDAVPVSRVYEVADTARQCAEAWRRFADALERRSGGSYASKAN